MASTKDIQEYILNLIQDEHECGNVETALESLRDSYPEKYIQSLIKLTEFILPKGIDIATIGDKVNEAGIKLSDEQLASLIENL